MKYGCNWKNRTGSFSKWEINERFNNSCARPGPWFNIKISSYQYSKSHCGDKTILRPSYLHNGISYTGNTTSLYWIGALEQNGTNVQLSHWNNSSGVRIICVALFLLLLTAITCEPPYIPEHGSVRIRRSETGPQAIFSCKDGYSLDGATVLLCTGSGFWNDTEPVCEGRGSSLDYFTISFHNLPWRFCNGLSVPIENFQEFLRINEDVNTWTAATSW